MSNASRQILLGVVAGLTIAVVTPTTRAQTRDPEIEKARFEARSESPDRRRRAMETLLAHGEEGARVLRPILKRRMAREVANLRALMKGGSGRKLRRLTAERLVAARKAALAVIYNKSIYPDEDHGRVGQPAVDEKVNAVRDLYDRAASTLRKEIPTLDQLLTALAEIYDFARRTGGVPPPADLATVKKCIDFLDRAVGTRKIDSGSSNRWEEKVKQAIRQVESEATPGEIKVVRLLNDYRRMMGRHPLAPNLLLMRAARKHSQEMEDLRYFSHTSPTAEHRTPSMRAGLEGYGGGCAENIARAASAEGAHSGWYNSSGHHRNMLGRHRVIGLGCSKGGGYWTQMLGSGGVYGGKDTPARYGLTTYLSRSASIPERDVESRKSLAVWCREQGLLRAMEREARQVLAVKSDDEEMRRLLDEHAADGRWLHAADATALEPNTVPDRIKALRLYLTDADPYRRLRAVRALARLFEPRAEKPLVRVLQDRHADVRIEAMLGLMIGIGKRVESALKGQLRAKTPSVRHFAAAALYRRGNAVGIKQLLKDLVGSEDATRASAGEALRFIAHQDFGYAWNADKSDRTRAAGRALTWFKSQVDDLDG